MNLKILLPFLLMILFVDKVDAAEPLCREVSGDIEGLEIGEIHILNQDVFTLDKAGENTSFHHIVNGLHIQTQKSVIKQELLISEGQFYQQRLVDESERKLRRLKYIHDASIEADMICAGKLVVKVRTTDNWTLTPSISLGRSGGVNRSTYEISESNLLGLGKEITLKSKSDEDRDSRLLRYKDNNLFGTDYMLSIKTAENSDGYYDSILFGKPFRQLDSRQAFLLDTQREEKQTASYQNGNIIGMTGQLSEGFTLEKGWSEGLKDDAVLRYKVGWNTLDNQYFNVTDYPDSVLPENINRRYPYLSLDYLEDKYIQRENLNVMGVTEDIYIGTNFSMMVGLLDKSWGSSNNGIKMSANYSFGKELDNNTLAFFDIGLSSEVNRDATDFNAFRVSGKWLHYSDINNSYYIKAAYQWADHLLITDEYTIGGDTGLRGYPIRYQTGNNKALLSVEKRTYFNWYPLKLLKFGVALFADVGSAWQQEDGAHFIKDVGIGIRLVSTRQSDAKVIHIDFAYPLDELDQVDGFQLVVEAKSQF